MTQSLTDQRSRSELVAELYERHAAGLFAYCHDQLGESSSAADAVVAVFTSVPIAEPPARAALFALARREIYRRDVSYALPTVNSIIDPATALIERVFRDIRPHQREVLLLTAVCGLTTNELSWVLEVAGDTADELTASARQRFSQTLTTATTAAKSAPFVAVDVAEIYDAIGVSPIADVLARLPWQSPVASVRARVLSSLPREDSAVAALKLPTKKLWPTTPTWPLPLADPNQVTNACVVQTEALSPPKPGRRSRHEATTQPIPRLRGAIMNALAENRTRKRRAPTPALDTPVTKAVDTVTPEVQASDTDTFDAFDAFRPIETDDQRVAPSKVEHRHVDPFSPMEESVHLPARAMPTPAVTSQAIPTQAIPTPAVPPQAAMPAQAVPAEESQAPAKPKRREKKPKPVKTGEYHFDWLWELVGFLICLAIAVLVFLAVPTLITP